MSALQLRAGLQLNCLFSSIFFLDKYQAKTDKIYVESLYLLPMALIKITSNLDGFGGVDMKRMLSNFGGKSTIEQVNDMEKKIRSTVEIQARTTFLRTIED